MKKDSSILLIVFSVIICVCSIGIDIIYWKHFPALYLAATAVGGIALVISVICLVLRLKKHNAEQKYYNRLMRLSMVSATVALLLPTVGTLITMFI